VKKLNPGIENAGDSVDSSRRSSLGLHELGRIESAVKKLHLQWRKGKNRRREQKRNLQKKFLRRTSYSRRTPPSNN
jgi:hypothetical protein